MGHEEKARAIHRQGSSCASAVYTAFSDVTGGRRDAPAPRSEGGKCGAVLAAEKLLRETGHGSVEEFDRAFLAKYGSLKCAELLGKRKSACNDFVGTAAALAEKMITGESRP